MGTVLLSLMPLSGSRSVHSVSVPFSMGTVLLADCRRSTPYMFSGFSPLLDGDGVASRYERTPAKLRRFSPLLDGDGVASMPVFPTRVLRGFSPLLDGDGVASRCGGGHCTHRIQFQSPSRWGRCCFAIMPATAAIRHWFSVPFSMGTVLLPLDHAPISKLLFQSPSRWGRCCFSRIGRLDGDSFSFQSPSRWGRCCFQRAGEPGGRSI